MVVGKGDYIDRLTLFIIKNGRLSNASKTTY